MFFFFQLIILFFLDSRRVASWVLGPNDGLHRRLGPWYVFLKLISCSIVLISSFLDLFNYLLKKRAEKIPPQPISTTTTNPTRHVNTAADRHNSSGREGREGGRDAPGFKTRRILNPRPKRRCKPSFGPLVFFFFYYFFFFLTNIFVLLDIYYYLLRGNNLEQHRHHHHLDTSKRQQQEQRQQEQEQQQEQEWQQQQ